MTEDDKLTFCQVCSNRNFNPQIGTYCGLTSEKPNFELSCPDFKVDNKALEQRKKELYSRVTTNKVSEKYTYPTSERAINKILSNLPEVRVIRRSKLDSWIMILILPIILGALTYSYLTGDEGTAKLLSQPLFYLMAVPSVLTTIYGIYHLRNKSPKITLTKEDITIHELNLTIPWWLILRVAYYQVGSGESGRIYLSIISLGNTEEINYQLKSMDISRRRLLATIEAYRAKSKNLL